MDDVSLDFERLLAKAHDAAEARERRGLPWGTFTQESVTELLRMNQDGIHKNIRIDDK